MKGLAVVLISIAAVLAPAMAQMLPQAAPQEVGMSKERLDRIRPMMEKYIADNQMAGAIAVIARRGKIAYYETFGTMDKESNKPMAKDAIFRLASMTKPIVTVAALTLYEQGKFSWLDPVSKYLPEFTDMKVAVDKTDATGRRVQYTVPTERPITVLDLVRHTNGIKEINIYDRNIADGIKLLAAQPLIHQPATVWNYSPGQDVLGRLIEVWSGKSLPAYLEESVLKPLHMVDAGFFLPEEKWNRLATLYNSGPNGEIVRAPAEAQEYANAGTTKKMPIFPRGAAGMLSSATDYTRFAQMLVSGGELDGVRILSPKTVELMGSDLLGDIPIGGGPMLPGYGFGLSVAVNRGPGRTATIGSAGEYYWEGAHASLFFVDPKEKLITVFMIQKSRGIAISREYKRMVYQAIVKMN